MEKTAKFRLHSHYRSFKNVLKGFFCSVEVVLENEISTSKYSVGN